VQPPPGGSPIDDEGLPGVLEGTPPGGVAPAGGLDESTAVEVNEIENELPAVPE
jgi:hypothetical protein